MELKRQLCCGNCGGGYGSARMLVLVCFFRGVEAVAALLIPERAHTLTIQDDTSFGAFLTGSFLS